MEIKPKDAKVYAGEGYGRVEIKFNTDDSMWIVVNSYADMIFLAIADENAHVSSPGMSLIAFLDALQQAATMAEGNR